MKTIKTYLITDSPTTCQIEQNWGYVILQNGKVIARDEGFANSNDAETAGKAEA